MTQIPKRTILLRLLAEFAIIVVGVLVALQVESWRDGRAEAARESEQLEALHADFVVNRERYAGTIADQERMMELSESLLTIIGRRVSVSPDSLGRLVMYGALSWYEVEPVTGAYDALIASGDIGLIQDVGLRRELADFFAELQAGFEDHDNLMDILAELQRLAAPWVASIAPSRPEARYESAPSDSVGVVQAVLDNDVFRGLLVLKLRLESNRLLRQEEGADAVDRILGLLESRMAGGQERAL